MGKPWKNYGKSPFLTFINPRSSMVSLLTKLGLKGVNVGKYTSTIDDLGMGKVQFLMENRHF